MCLKLVELFIHGLVFSRGSLSDQSGATGAVQTTKENFIWCFATRLIPRVRITGGCACFMSIRAPSRKVITQRDHLPAHHSDHRTGLLSYLSTIFRGTLKCHGSHDFETSCSHPFTRPQFYILSFSLIFLSRMGSNHP